MSCLLLLFSKHLEINGKLLLGTEGWHGLLRRRTGVTRRVVLDIVARSVRATRQARNQDPCVDRGYQKSFHCFPSPIENALVAKTCTGLAAECQARNSGA